MIHFLTLFLILRKKSNTLRSLSNQISGQSVRSFRDPSTTFFAMAPLIINSTTTAITIEATKLIITSECYISDNPMVSNTENFWVSGPVLGCYLLIAIFLGYLVVWASASWAETSLLQDLRRLPEKEVHKRIRELWNETFEEGGFEW